MPCADSSSYYRSLQEGGDELHHAGELPVADAP